MYREYVILVIGAIVALFSAPRASAQLFHNGERLYYRAAYRAKMIPNTEVGEVTIDTTLDTLRNQEVYRVVGNGQTLPFFRWFFKMNDTYTIWVDRTTQKTLRFESDLHENDYTFRSHYNYDWERMEVSTWSQRRQNTPRTKLMKLSQESMDAVSLYFNLRSVDLNTFRAGERHRLDLVLEDTIRHLRYRFIERDTIKVPRVGRFAAMKFACTLGSSEEFSFTDGTEFLIWITEDENKIPVMLSSPVRVGEVRAYLRRYEGLKYPLSSLIEKK